MKDLAEKVYRNCFLDIKKCCSDIPGATAVSKEHAKVLASVAIIFASKLHQDENEIIKKASYFLSKWVREEYEARRLASSTRRSSVEDFTVKEWGSPNPFLKEISNSPSLDSIKNWVKDPKANTEERVLKIDSIETILNICDTILLKYGPHAMLWTIYYLSQNESYNEILDKLGFEKDELSEKELNRRIRHIQRTVEKIKKVIQ